MLKLLLMLSGHIYLTWLVLHETATVLGHVLCTPDRLQYMSLYSKLHMQVYVHLATCTFSRMTEIFYMLLR